MMLTEPGQRCGGEWSGSINFSENPTSNETKRCLCKNRSVETLTNSFLSHSSHAGANSSCKGENIELFRADLPVCSIKVMLGPIYLCYTSDGAKFKPAKFESMLCFSGCGGCIELTMVECGFVGKTRVEFGFVGKRYTGGASLSLKALGRRNADVAVFSGMASCCD